MKIKLDTRVSEETGRGTKACGQGTSQKVGARLGKISERR